MVEAVSNMQKIQTAGMNKTVLPVIAMIGIFDKQNEPVVLQNYLAKHLKKETDAKVAYAEQTL